MAATPGTSAKNHAGLPALHPYRRRDSRLRRLPMTPMIRTKRSLLIATILVTAGLLAAVALSGGSSRIRPSGILFEVAFLLLAVFFTWLLPVRWKWRVLSLVMLVAAASAFSSYQSSLVFGKVELRTAAVLQDFLFYSLEALAFLGVVRLIDRWIEMLRTRPSRSGPDREAAEAEVNETERIVDRRLSRLLEQHRFDGVSDLLDSEEELRALTPRELVIRGRVIQLGNGERHSLPEAEAAFLQALDMDPEYVPALLELGWYYHAVQDDASQGLAYFERALTEARELIIEAEKGRDECKSELTKDRTPEG